MGIQEVTHQKENWIRKRCKIQAFHLDHHSMESHCSSKEWNWHTEQTKNKNDLINPRSSLPFSEFINPNDEKCHGFPSELFFPLNTCQSPCKISWTSPSSTYGTAPCQFSEPSLIHLVPENPVERVLQLPELLMLIFSNLVSIEDTLFLLGSSPGNSPTQSHGISWESRRILYPCLFVSKLWYACAVPLIWRSIEFDSRSALESWCQTILTEEWRESTKMDMKDDCLKGLDIALTQEKDRLVKRDETYPLPNQQHLVLLENKSAIQSITHDFTFEPISDRKPFTLQMNAKGEKQRNKDSLIGSSKHLCRYIRSLRCHKLEVVNSKLFLSIATFIPFLNSLEFYVCKHLRNEVIKEFSRRCGRTLQSIKLPGCSQISDDAVIEIAKNCQVLQHLDLRACSLVTDESIKRIAESCIRLKYLNVGRFIDGNVITDASIIAVAKLPHINTLGLAGCGITDKSIIALSTHAYPVLERLSLNSCPFISNHAISVALFRLLQLTVFEVRHCPNISAIHMLAQMMQKGIRVEMCDRLKFLFHEHYEEVVLSSQDL